MKRISVFMLIGMALINNAFSQNSLDDLNVVLKHNFEDNTIGKYLHTEWSADWSNPSFCNRQDKLKIVQNTNDSENPTKTLQLDFPANSLGPSEGGTHFPVDLKGKYEELYVSYDLMFMPGFQFQKGGKIPSVKGGSITANEITTDGFSGGLMFKDGGRILFYIYYPDNPNKGGISITWGSPYALNPIEGSKMEVTYTSGTMSQSKPGEWHNLTYRMVLNTVKSTGGGNYDGILEAFFDGKLVTQISKICFRNTSNLGIDVMRIYSFFGGSTDVYRNPIAEWLKLDNFLLYTFKSEANVPRGNTLSPTNRTINYWRKFGNTAATNNAPVITAQQFIVKESTLSNNLIGSIIAKDADAGQTLTYSITSGNESGIYSINSKTGVLSSTGSNIFVPGTVTHQLGIKVTDNGTSPKSASATITVNLVSDTPVAETNNPPVINAQQFIVNESTFSNNLIGSVIARDADAGQTLTYSITSGNESGIYSINSKTGVLSSTGSNIFVPGTVTHQLGIKVTDNGTSPKSTSAIITVNLIGDTPVVETNNPPVITAQQFIVKESTISDNLIGSVIAKDADAGQTLTYSITSGNGSGVFAINSQTGVLKTTNSNIFGPMATTYELTIKVTDSATEPESASAKITINLIGESGIVYIDPENTNDAFANGSITHPYASWKDIVWKEGYTYLQKGGTTTTVDKILIGANRVTLGAYGEGDLPVIASNTNTYLISGFEKAGITIRELNLQAPNAVSSIYFLGNTGDSIIVEHCQLNANVNAVKVANGNTLVVRYNSISSHGEGVYSSATDNQVYYNIFKNCEEAINIMGNSAIAKIYNNVFYNNDESLSVTYADLTLYNNIFYLNSPGQSAINHGTGNIQSNNNIYYPEQAGFITIASAVFNNLQQLQQAMKIDINSFIADPQFLDMYDDNFLLAENSPAINAGVDLNLGLDLLGSSVPLSGAADIGVHEFTGIISPPENQEQPSLMLYPNPSTGKFNIMAELNQQQGGIDNNIADKNEIRVVDLTGKTVFARQLDDFAESTFTDQVELTGISNGLYFVILQIADKVVKEKILIKN